MRYVVAGASGFLGRALCADLARDGHNVVRLVRRVPRAPDESSWNPETGRVDVEVLAAADVVVHLAGASIGRPWTPRYRDLIKRSRVDTTRTLARALAGLGASRPRLVCQSATGYYPKDRDGESYAEDGPLGSGFLAEVVGSWEAAARPAVDAGCPVAFLRTGLVLSRSGGAFPLMVIPFRLGLGGRLGTGRQYMPMVSLPDWVRAVRHVIDRELTGAVNITIPTPPTNAQFTAALGRALGRPTVLRVPATALRLALGGLSAELLGSVHVAPRRLLETGFTFTAPDVDAVVRTALGH